MKKLVIISVIGIIAIGIGILLFTNTDELIFSVIDESIDQVKIDTQTFNVLTNTFPVNSMCDFTLIYIESYYRSALGDHTYWYYQNFGDILDEYKEDLTILNEIGIAWNDPELDMIHQKYVEKIKTRINPSLLDKFPFSKPMSGTGLVTISSKHLNEDPECADILETNYKDLIYVMDNVEYQKLSQYVQSEPLLSEKIIEETKDDHYAFKAEQICDAQTTSSSDCAIVLEQATIELQNADKKLEEAKSRWKDVCRNIIAGSCDQEFFVVQEATNNYLDKNKKILSIIHSTDERLVEFGLLVREHTLWSQFCEFTYATDSMCNELEITNKKLDEFNSATMNKCADNHNDVCDKRILSIFALCTTTPLFENMKICSDQRYETYVNESDFST